MSERESGGRRGEESKMSERDGGRRGERRAR